MMIIRLGIVGNKVGIFSGATLALGKYNSYSMELFLGWR